jgi:hypothetical protein
VQMTTARADSHGAANAKVAQAPTEPETFVVTVADETAATSPAE